MTYFQLYARFQRLVDNLGYNAACASDEYKSFAHELNAAYLREDWDSRRKEWLKKRRQLFRELHQVETGFPTGLFA